MSFSFCIDGLTLSSGTLWYNVEFRVNVMVLLHHKAVDFKRALKLTLAKVNLEKLNLKKKKEKKRRHTRHVCTRLDW